MSFIDSVNNTMKAMGINPIATPVVVATPPVVTLVSAELLSKMSCSEPVLWAPFLNDACKNNQINTRLRIAAFLANVLNETGNLSSLHESLNYSAQALLAQWPSHFTPTQAQAYGRTLDHAANQSMIGNLAYNGRLGNRLGTSDGYDDRGVGGMQTTGRANLLNLATHIKWTGTIEELVTYLQTKVGAANSAAYFWQDANCNKFADMGDIETVRKIINGGLIGIDNVKLLYSKLLGNIKL